MDGRVIKQQVFRNYFVIFWLPANQLRLNTVVALPCTAYFHGSNDARKAMKFCKDAKFLLQNTE
jgi:hypothetical protein